MAVYAARSELYARELEDRGIAPATIAPSWSWSPAGTAVSTGRTYSIIAPSSATDGALPATEVPEPPAPRGSPSSRGATGADAVRQHQVAPRRGHGPPVPPPHKCQVTIFMLSPPWRSPTKSGCKRRVDRAGGR